MIGSMKFILLTLIVQYIQGRTLFDATFNDEMSSIIEKYEHKRDEDNLKITTLKSIKKEISDAPAFIEKFGDDTEREFNTVEDKSQFEDFSSLISKFIGNRPSKSIAYHGKRKTNNNNLKNFDHNSRRSATYHGKKETFSQLRDEDLYRDILKTILDDSSKSAAYHGEKRTEDGDQKEENESLLDMMAALLEAPGSRSSAYHGKKEIVEEKGHDDGKDKTEKKKEVNDKTKKETSEEEGNEKKSFLTIRKKTKKKKPITEAITQPTTRQTFVRSSTQMKTIKSTPSRSTAYHGKKDEEQKVSKKKSEKENANLDNVLKRLTNMLDKRISAEASAI